MALGMTTCKVFHKAKSELEVRVSAVYPGNGCYSSTSASLQTQILNSLQNLSRVSSEHCDKPHTVDLLFNMLTFTYGCRSCVCLHSPSKISPKCKFLRWLVYIVRGKSSLLAAWEAVFHIRFLLRETYASTSASISASTTDSGCNWGCTELWRGLTLGISNLDCVMLGFRMCSCINWSV